MTDVTVISATDIQIATVGFVGPPGPPGPAAPNLMGNLYLQSATNLTIPLISSARYAFTIGGLYNLHCSSGSIFLAIKINGIDVTGLTGLNVTMTPQSPVSTANFDVEIGDRVTMVLSGGTIAADLEFTMVGNLIIN